MPDELAQTLSSPRHFEQASEMVAKQMIADAITHGNDIDEYADAGVEVVHVMQIGADRTGTGAAGFFACYRDQVPPRLREL